MIDFVEKVRLIQEGKTMPHARRKDLDTSWEAARSVKAISETQEAILELYLTYGPLMDERLIDFYQNAFGYPKASESGIRSRRAELVEMGLVKCTNVKGKTRSGRSSYYWEANKEALSSQQETLF
jgi:hypothetical protein